MKGRLKFFSLATLQSAPAEPLSVSRQQYPSFRSKAPRRSNPARSNERTLAGLFTDDRPNSSSRCFDTFFIVLSPFFPATPGYAAPLPAATPTSYVKFSRAMGNDRATASELYPKFLRLSQLKLLESQTPVPILL